MTGVSFRPGDRVIYVPDHAKGDLAHPDCQRGVVSAVGGGSGVVFIRFAASIASVGFDRAAGKACDPETLVLDIPA